MHPGHQLLYLCVLNGLAAGIFLTDISNQIDAVISTCNDIDRNLGGALQRSSRADIGRHGRRSPWVVLTVGVNQASGVIDVPATGESVDFFLGPSFIDPVRLALWTSGKEHGTQVEVIFHGDQARYNRWSSGRWADLPPTERFVAHKPKPLTIESVA